MDDQFFHIICHVDSALQTKIERGGFVDLEKLLPRDPTRKLIDESRMELVNHDGSTLFVPISDRESRINGIRRWEQGFRVYATIYTRQNPHQAAEIWQYIYTINLAANSFAWENVASYDYTFHQLMGEYPGRSWATIYQQMWSLTIRDPLPRQSGNSSAVARNSAASGARNNHDNYCWKFNRFRTRCKFDHCCYYCDGYGHGSFNCPKKNKYRDSKECRHDKFDEHRGGPEGDHKSSKAGCK